MKNMGGMGPRDQGPCTQGPKWPLMKALAKGMPAMPVSKAKAA